MKKEAKDEKYHPHWRGSELESRYLNSKAEFSSKNYLVILFLWFVTFAWFIFSPSALVSIGIQYSVMGVAIWIGGTIFWIALAIIALRKANFPSYETKIFWKLGETLENLDLYWESMYGPKSKDVFLDKADEKFRKALSYMKYIIPSYKTRAEMINKHVHLPLKALRKKLEQKFLPMQLILGKGIRRVYDRLEELALIFYEYDLDKLLEFDKSLEGIPESDIKKIDIRAVFFGFWTTKIGKFIISFALGIGLSMSLFYGLCRFSIENFLQLLQDPAGITGLGGVVSIFTVAIWEALIRG